MFVLVDCTTFQPVQLAKLMNTGNYVPDQKCVFRKRNLRFSGRFYQGWDRTWTPWKSLRIVKSQEILKTRVLGQKKPKKLELAFLKLCVSRCISDWLFLKLYLARCTSDWHFLKLCLARCIGKKNLKKTLKTLK